MRAHLFCYCACAIRGTYVSGTNTIICDSNCTSLDSNES